MRLPRINARTVLDLLMGLEFRWRRRWCAMFGHRFPVKYGLTRAGDPPEFCSRCLAPFYLPPWPLPPGVAAKAAEYAEHRRERLDAAIDEAPLWRWNP